MTLGICEINGRGRENLYTPYHCKFVKKFQLIRQMSSSEFSKYCGAKVSPVNRRKKASMKRGRFFDIEAENIQKGQFFTRIW